MIVEVRHNDIETALRIFRQRVQQSGILRDLRHREAFEIRSKKRKRKNREALSRLRKRQKKTS
jgi:ribosomal protein S21